MKKFLVFIFCAALCQVLASAVMADSPTVQYAAITATAQDYSDAALITEGLNSWEEAAAVDNCIFVVIYSLDAAGSPAQLNADIEFMQDEPGLILSNVAISGSARAESGLYLLGNAAVIWGSVTLSGSSATGDAPAALTSLPGPHSVIGATDDAKIRHTYTDDAEIGMLSAYDLVVNSGVTLEVAAPESDDYHHVLTVEHSLTVNGELTADNGQELVLKSGAAIGDFTLYEEDEEGGYRVYDFTGEADETFLFQAAAVYGEGSASVTGLWVHTPGGGGPGPGPIGEPQEFTVIAGENGSLSFDGEAIPTGESVITAAIGNEIIITPDPGFAVHSVTESLPPYDELDTVDIMRYLSYNGDGTFTLTLQNVWQDMRLEIAFAPVSADDIGKILNKGYAVLNGSEAELKSSLVREFGYFGYAIDPADIAILEEPTAIANGYGTFVFTLSLASATSVETTGYVVEEYSDVIFKFSGTKNGVPVDEIRVAGEEDGINGEFGAAAQDEGTIEIFGPYNTHMEGWTSPDVFDAFDAENGTANKLIVKHPFYRVQLHIGNASLDGEYALNWFAFDLIQDDALCVEVTASDQVSEQRTFEWELNRYAQLTGGSYASDVYFANDEVKLSLPSSGIGAAESLSIETGDFTGYTVAGADDAYTITFHSNYYHEVTLNLTINGSVQRELTLRRVGVYIDDYNHQDMVFHGTQCGSRIDFTEETSFRIYATYYIPDGGIVAPYGLFVTYTWADGTTTTEIITEPENNPFYAEDEFWPGDGFVDGVFFNEGWASSCDYLLYAGADANSAPVSVGVTVLKDAPAGDSFGGVTFGSGAGVTWTQEH